MQKALIANLNRSVKKRATRSMIQTAPITSKKSLKWQFLLPSRNACSNAPAAQKFLDLRRCSAITSHYTRIRINTNATTAVALSPIATTYSLTSRLTKRRCSAALSALSSFRHSHCWAHISVTSTELQNDELTVLIKGNYKLFRLKLLIKI